MPQIWPMNWVILFWIFALTFVMFMAFLYFTNFSPKISLEKSHQTTLSHLDWKW
uniref:ATP synthase F0 subunit 8 n=1 Tax=Daphnia pulex TaxID=6669 RepID=Q2F240_DAPPU|nr:ATP synthase F0 subunit 8 [Daphnia pulex]